MQTFLKRNKNKEFHISKSFLVTEMAGRKFPNPSDNRIFIKHKKNRTIVPFKSYRRYVTYYRANVLLLGKSKHTGCTIIWDLCRLYLIQIHLVGQLQLGPNLVVTFGSLVVRNVRNYCDVKYAVFGCFPIVSLKKLFLASCIAN